MRAGGRIASPFTLSPSKGRADPVIAPFALSPSKGGRTWRSRSSGLLALLMLVSGCAIVHEQGPQSRPGREQGMLLYTVGRLAFEAPAGWQARGDPSHVEIVSPSGDARIDAQRVARKFPDDAQCLTNAEQALARGASQLTNVRRHQTTLASRKALAQEADQGRWHGWAWATCDRGEQYRVFFTGLSPLKDEALRAVRIIPASARLAAGAEGRS